MKTLAPLTSVVALMTAPALADVPDVVTDILPIHSLAARVMDGVGEPALLVRPGASPHGYSLRPSEAAALEGSDLVFIVGEPLTPWLDGVLDNLADDAEVIELMEVQGTTLLEGREGATFEAHNHDHGDEDDHEEHDDHDDHDHEEHDDHDDHDHEEHDDHDDHDHEEHDDHDDHDHEEHDDHDDHDHDEHAEEDHDDHDHDDHAGHGHVDPHAWLDPENAKAWLDVMAAELSSLDPENAGTYFANAAAGKEEIDAAAAQVAEMLDPELSFVVFHDAYQYFESRFGISAAGAISLSDASDPGAARISEIRATIVDLGVTCVLKEPQFNDALIATVTEGAEVAISEIDPLGTGQEQGPGLYPALLLAMGESLAGCQ